MSDQDHSPVSLPSGSYDADKLQKGLDAATRAPAGERDAAVAAAISAASPPAPTGPAAVSDTEIVAVTREIAPGVTVTEHMQVFKPAAADEPAEDPAPVAAEADAPATRKKG